MAELLRASGLAEQLFDSDTSRCTPGDSNGGNGHDKMRYSRR